MHERGPAKSTEERPQLYHPSPASLPSLWDPSSSSRERRLTRKVPSQGCSIRQHLPLTLSAVGTSALQVLALGLCGHVSTAQGPHWHCKKSACCGKGQGCCRRFLHCRLPYHPACCSWGTRTVRQYAARPFRHKPVCPCRGAPGARKDFKRLWRDHPGRDRGRLHGREAPRARHAPGTAAPGASQTTKHPWPCCISTTLCALL